MSGDCDPSLSPPLLHILGERTTKCRKRGQRPRTDGGGKRGRNGGDMGEKKRGDGRVGEGLFFLPKGFLNTLTLSFFAELSFARI